jgi:nucleoside-diphosphate-sugar epimerase
VGLTVAVTGPTGTFGHGLMPLLQADGRVDRVTGIARRPFDPAREGWTKLAFRQGDVRDRSTLRQAFEGADVVVHLAFVVTGAGAGRETIRAINVDGTRNAFAAAADAGVARFVYTSSVAAYGFDRDNPIGMTEDWPVRRAAHLFYAQEKAEIEQRLAAEAVVHPEVDVYVLRPPIVLGPHTTGAKTMWPAPLEPVGRALAAAIGRLPVPLPAIVPPLPLQFVHEEDVGDALLRCIAGAGPPGAYNVAGDGVLTAVDVARELGLAVLPAPGRPIRAAARLLAGVPFAPPVAGWAEAMSHPAIVDTGKARRELGWRPRYSGLEALRDTLHRR